MNILKLVDQYIDRVLLVFVFLMLSFMVSNLAAPIMIDVKIYASGDPEVYIYCATGSLVPPARFVANGAVPLGQESYC